MSSTTWDTYHRRSEAVNDVVATIEAAPTGELPWPDVAAETFAGPDDLLVALHDLWTRRLESRVELALEIGEEELAESVARAWREAAAALPGVRRVLDRHAGAPALRHHQLSEHRLMAVAAGLATLDDPVSYSARLGEDFVARVRSGPHSVAAVRRQPLVQRLREAIAGVG